MFETRCECSFSRASSSSLLKGGASSAAEANAANKRVGIQQDRLPHGCLLRCFWVCGRRERARGSVKIADRDHVEPVMARCKFGSSSTIKLCAGRASSSGSSVFPPNAHTELFGRGLGLGRSLLAAPRGLPLALVPQEYLSSAQNFLRVPARPSLTPKSRDLGS